MWCDCFLKHLVVTRWDDLTPLRLWPATPPAGNLIVHRLVEPFTARAHRRRWIQAQMFSFGWTACKPQRVIVFERFIYPKCTRPDPLFSNYWLTSNPHWLFYMKQFSHYCSLHISGTHKNKVERILAHWKRDQNQRVHLCFFLSFAGVFHLKGPFCWQVRLNLNCFICQWYLFAQKQPPPTFFLRGGGWTHCGLNCATRSD